jgi:hypothetical protein
MNISKIALVAASLVMLSAANAMAGSRNGFEECSFDVKYCDTGSKISTDTVTRHGSESQVNGVSTNGDSAFFNPAYPNAKSGHDYPY